MDTVTRQVTFTVNHDVKITMAQDLTTDMERLHGKEQGRSDLNCRLATLTLTPAKTYTR